MSDCIIFTGYRQRGGAGYGEVVVNQKKWLAHRYAWFIANGAIPNGLHVCHRCNNKGCINVEHLYLATNQQNASDAVRDGLWGINQNERKTKCPKCGSAFSINQYGRYCKPCKQASNERTRKARRARAAIDAARAGKGAT